MLLKILTLVGLFAVAAVLLGVILSVIDHFFKDIDL